MWFDGKLIRKDGLFVPRELQAAEPGESEVAGFLRSPLEDVQELLHGRGEHLVLFVNGGQRTEEFGPLDPDFGQRLLGHFLQDGGLGHDGDAGLDFHRALDGFDVVELHHRLHRHAVVLQDFVNGFAGGNIGFEADEFLARSTATSLIDFVFGQRMLRMADQHQRILAQGDQLQLGVLGRIGHQPQIHHVAQHVLINLVGPAVFDMDIDGGKELEEFFQVRRQIVQADAVNGRHANGARK